MESGYKLPLVRGAIYGSDSRKVYEKHAESFGWDKRQANQFGKQGLPLYAQSATPEGYSVWCIAHSNFSGDKGGKWTNEISPDMDTIREFWESFSAIGKSDNTIRVTFVKVQGGYEFFGVYKLDPGVEEVQKDGKTQWVKTYRCISERYPFKAD